MKQVALFCLVLSMCVLEVRADCHPTSVVLINDFLSGPCPRFTKYNERQVTWSSGFYNITGFNTSGQGECTSSGTPCYPQFYVPVTGEGFIYQDIANNYVVNGACKPAPIRRLKQTHSCSGAGACTIPFRICPRGQGWDEDVCGCTCAGDPLPSLTATASIAGQSNIDDPPDTDLACPSPIIIDTLGNGFTLTSAQGGVNFDLDNDGTAEQLSWTTAGADDAWLALDRNGNGQINNGAELFGNFTPQPEPPQGSERNGFLALAEYDKAANGGNGDGQIDSQDSIFASLRLWQDTNHNGLSEATELKTLESQQVESIDLQYKQSKKRDQHGNWFRYRAKVDDARHSHVGRWAWDVFLVSAPLN